MKERKSDIKAFNAVELNEEQKEARRLIYENQIVVITGRAGCGKSLVSANASLQLLKNKEIKRILVARPAIEVGKSLGALPGNLGEKFDPYIEAFLENLGKCCQNNSDLVDMVTTSKVVGFPVQFVRSKTIDDILVVEESQNLTESEMLAILTRLGKQGRIVINGDNEQQDTNHPNNGLKFVMEMAKKIHEIKVIKLKENHRSDLVGKILEYVYGK